MEEDIKITGEIDIGETIKSNIDYWKNNYFEKEKEVKNLIARNKELEKHYIHEQEYMNGEVFSAKQMHFIDDNYIDKSKVKEKIEELKEDEKNQVYSLNPYTKDVAFTNINHKEEIEVLQELLDWEGI